MCLEYASKLFVSDEGQQSPRTLCDGGGEGSPQECPAYRPEISSEIVHQEPDAMEDESFQNPENSGQGLYRDNGQGIHQQGRQDTDRGMYVV